ncbi:MAG: antitermination protein NusG [Flavobacteriales bacterium CG_4_9_14_3_um_filter_40_17]|nr:MAG: antitermination protein NusG [Flavobacteriales bacterium CG_4_9_14_3_um_filter_40_17]
MNWYVLYTKPRTEKKTAETLESLGIECYCPTTIQVRQWSDRKKKVETPLFTSHVFVKLAEKDRNSVFRVSHVVRYLFWLGKPAVVRNNEIEAIKNWLDDENATVEVIPYKIGDKLTVSEGPFKNQTGIVHDVNKKEVTVILESLGCMVRMKWKDCLDQNKVKTQRSLVV